MQLAFACLKRHSYDPQLILKHYKLRAQGQSELLRVSQLDNEQLKVLFEISMTRSTAVRCLKIVFQALDPRAGAVYFLRTR